MTKHQSTLKLLTAKQKKKALQKIIEGHVQEAVMQDRINYQLLTPSYSMMDAEGPDYLILWEKTAQDFKQRYIEGKTEKWEEKVLFTWFVSRGEERNSLRAQRKVACTLDWPRVQSSLELYVKLKEAYLHQNYVPRVQDVPRECRSAFTKALFSLYLSSSGGSKIQKS